MKWWSNLLALNWRSIFSALLLGFTLFLAFLALGLTLGGLVGLSESPVLGTVLSAAFALVGPLALLYFAPENSTRKFMAVHPGLWLLPLCIGVCGGVVSGIVVRRNDYLSFVDESLDHKLKAMGFTDKDSAQIKSRLANAVAPADLLPKRTSESSGLLASGSEQPIQQRPLGDMVANEIARYRDKKDDAQLVKKFREDWKLGPIMDKISLEAGKPLSDTEMIEALLRR